MRLGTILLIIGIACYICAPLAYMLNLSPTRVLMPGDFMLVLFVLGGLMAFAGIVILHRLKLQQHARQ